MKPTLRIFGALGLLALLSGCASYVQPTAFIRQINHADRIVVTNTFPEPPAMLGLANDRPRPPGITLTGQDAWEIIRAVYWLREPREDEYLRSATFYEWQLQFYRGNQLLGSAGLSENLIDCGDLEYHTPLALKKLYGRAVRSGPE